MYIIVNKGIFLGPTTFKSCATLWDLWDPTKLMNIQA